MQKANKDINSNRMALGFMNYDKVGEIYEEGSLIGQKTAI